MHGDCDARKAKHLGTFNSAQTFERFLCRAVGTDHDDVRLVKIDNRLATDAADREVVKRLMVAAAKKYRNELCWCGRFGKRRKLLFRIDRNGGIIYS